MKFAISHHFERDKHKMRLAVVLLLVSGLFLLMCSNDPAGPDDEPPPAQFGKLLQGVVFEPNSGPPGTPVTLVGLDSLPVDSGFSMRIGNLQAPLITFSGEPVRTAIPLNLDTTGALNRGATAAKTVYLMYDGVINDSVPNAITIDSLPPAPGAVDSVLTKLSEGSQALKQIALALQSPDTLLLATCDAMDELLYNGEYSLRAILDGTAPIEGYDSTVAGLFGSLLVTTGAVDIIANWSDTLQVAARIAQRVAANSQNPAALSDQELADRMQLHDYLESFGNQVIGQTALSWTYVSSIIGGVAIAAPVVGVYEFIVSWVLGELDFIVNKLAVAMLPSDVTRLDLDFLDHQIPVGDTTAAVVYISAKNNPPNITPADIIGQVLNGLTLTQWIGDRLGPGATRTLSAIIKDIVNWALGTITGILSANYNSPTSLDVALPAATWDSVRVLTPGCIDLMSPDLSKMQYITGSYNGRAGDSIGPVGLQMRTQPGGASVYRNSILNSLGYAGGAFGDDVFTSNTDTVTIVSNLGLEVDFASTMTPGGANQLGVIAGYLSSSGTLIPHDNIEIHLTVTYGSAETPQGFTDANGHFGSRIDIDSTADSVIVSIFAYGEYNSQADTTVFSFKHISSEIAFISDKDGDPAIYTISPDGTALTFVTSLGGIEKNKLAVHSFSASPDGRYYLFSGYFKDPFTSFGWSEQIWTCSRAGFLRRIGRDFAEVLPGWGMSDQLWSPVETDVFVYNAYKKQGKPNPSVLFTENASTFDRDSLGPYPLDATGNAIGTYVPVFSPDGQRIAFRSGIEFNQNISICARNGQGTTTLVETNKVQQMYWSQNGSAMIAPLNETSNGVIRSYTVPGGTEQTLVTLGPSVTVADVEIFSSVNAFAFLEGGASPGTIQVYSLLDGGIHTVITNTSAEGIAVSPDDQFVVFANQSLGGDLFKVNMATGEMTQLTSSNVAATRHIVWYSQP